MKYDIFGKALMNNVKYAKIETKWQGKLTPDLYNKLIS
jgi:hypothetical protein